MPFLLVPKRFGAQPQYVAPIDRQGLGKGVQLLFNPALGPIDLVTGRVWSPSGTPSIVTSQLGKVFSFDGFASDDAYQYTGYPEISGNIGTFFMWAPIVGGADSFGHIFLSNSTSSAQYFQVANDSTIFAFAQQSTGAITWYNTTNRSLVLASGGTAATMKAYLDGLATGLTWATTPTSWASGSKDMSVGKYSGGTDWDFSGTMLSVGYTTQVWGAAEAKAFHDSKGLALLKAPSRKLWVIPPSGITLVGASSTQANASGTGAITQTHILVGANGTQANASSTGSIAGDANLTVASCVQANASSTGAATQTHVLVGAASSQANASSTGSIAGGANLTAAASTQANASSASAITQTHALVGAASVQANPSFTGAITQAHVLVMAASVQDNIAAASAIVQAHILAAANSTQSNTGGTGAITISTGNLTAAPSTQINSGGTGTISMVGTVPDAFLASMTTSTAIKKPGVPTGTPEWLKTTIEIVLGRRGNKITPPAEQSLTFSATPTQAECEALYQYTNSVRTAISDLINRLDS